METVAQLVVEKIGLYVGCAIVIGAAWALAKWYLKAAFMNQVRESAINQSGARWFTRR